MKYMLTGEHSLELPILCTFSPESGQENYKQGTAYLLQEPHGHASVADAGQLGGGVESGPEAGQPVPCLGLVLLGGVKVVGQDALHRSGRVS